MGILVYVQCTNCDQYLDRGAILDEVCGSCLRTLEPEVVLAGMVDLERQEAL